VRYCEDGEGGARIPAAAYDSDGELDAGAIFCAECRSKDSTDVRDSCHSLNSSPLVCSNKEGTSLRALCVPSFHRLMVYGVTQRRVLMTTVRHAFGGGTQKC